MTQPVVFLSYRRSDASGSAGRLFDLLSQKLPDTQIFMDVEALEPASTFLTPSTGS